MSKEPKGMSRREAIRTLTGTALASTVASSMLSAQERPKASSPAAQSATRAPHVPRSQKPTILWITGEGIPLRVLSCYGGQLIKSPHIDRVANEGMRFENSFVTNALCARSRATLLTGKYDHLYGMISNPPNTTDGMTHPSFNAAQETIAKILRRSIKTTPAARPGFGPPPATTKEHPRRLINVVTKADDNTKQWKARNGQAF